MRPDAVLVEVKESGLSYADILRKVKHGEGAKDVALKVSKLRRTKDGLLRTELQKGVKADSVEHVIKGALQDPGVVRRLTSTVTLEVLGIDKVSTLQEVKEAIVAVLGAEHAGSITARTMYPGN